MEDPLSEREHDLKQFAKNSYIHGGRNRAKMLEEKGLHDYQELTSDMVRSQNARVYYNMFTNDMVIGYRGTDLKGHPEDLIPDAHIVLEGLNAGFLSGSKRHREAGDLAELMRREMPDSAITLVGHSLGGSLAEYAGSKVKDSKVVTFNQAMLKLGKKGLGKKRHTDIRKRGDWTSLLTMTGTHRKVKSYGSYADIFRGPLHAHTLDNIDQEHDEGSGLYSWEKKKKRVEDEKIN